MENDGLIRYDDIFSRYSTSTPARRLALWRRVNSYRTLLSPTDWGLVMKAHRDVGIDIAIEQAEKILRGQSLTDPPETPP